MYQGIALLCSVNLVLNKVAVAVANVGQDKAEENSWSLFAAVSRRKSRADQDSRQQVQVILLREFGKFCSPY